MEQMKPISLVDALDAITTKGVYMSREAVQALSRHEFRQALATLPQKAKAAASWAAEAYNQGSVIIIDHRFQSRLLDIRQPWGPTALLRLIEAGLVTPYNHLEGASWSIWLARQKLRKAVSFTEPKEDGSVELLVEGFQRWTFHNCELRGVNFSFTPMGGAVFHNCDLRGASFEGSQLWGADFVDCKLDGVSFEHADLRDVEFLNCEMNLVRAGSAKTDSETRFVGCSWKKIQLPENLETQAVPREAAG